MGGLLSGWDCEYYGQAPQFLHGGTGLNLTAVADMIPYDLCWNSVV